MATAPAPAAESTRKWRAQCVACGCFLKSFSRTELAQHKSCVVTINNLIQQNSNLCNRVVLALPFDLPLRIPVPNGRKTHCPSGHEYTEQNTYLDPNGWRHCRKCKDAEQEARRTRIFELQLRRLLEPDVPRQAKGNEPFGGRSHA